MFDLMALFDAGSWQMEVTPVRHSPPGAPATCHRQGHGALSWLWHQAWAGLRQALSPDPFPAMPEFTGFPGQASG